ncbi:hypothetical protein BDW02DRAFT_567289 [Decorospora gaudefroyi]|uniref:Uncharacterized protein n=1 Tax=Decorospora gaudefroyi TaxID=184978 RepID=A0A6A5KK80_9PLEO|nr:hypothetical protein BDW02DRAFT_567289 [Decorospora gaudefroyi]
MGLHIRLHYHFSRPKNLEHVKSTSKRTTTPDAPIPPPTPQPRLPRTTVSRTTVIPPFQSPYRNSRTQPPPYTILEPPEVPSRHPQQGPIRTYPPRRVHPDDRLPWHPQPGSIRTHTPRKPSSAIPVLHQEPVDGPLMRRRSTTALRPPIPQSIRHPDIQYPDPAPTMQARRTVAGDRPRLCRQQSTPVLRAHHPTHVQTATSHDMPGSGPTPPILIGRQRSTHQLPLAPNRPTELGKRHSMPLPPRDVDHAQERRDWHMCKHCQRRKEGVMSVKRWLSR